MKKYKQIINIGKFPPPVGGVSYFLKRLKQHMDESQLCNVFIDVSQIDVKRKRTKGVKCMSHLEAFIWLLFTKRSVIVFHSNRFPVLIGAFFLSFRHKIVIFTHGESILANASKTKRFLLHRVSALVSPIEQLTTRIKKTYSELQGKVYHIPFVLFPPSVGVIQDFSIQEMRTSYKFLISAYAYDIKPMNGIDLYGVDLLIELMCNLRDKGYDDVGMVLLMPSCTDTEFSRVRLEKMESEKLGNRLLIHRQRLEEASDLFALSDLYVRPSCSDGDSFAIWEALHVGTPVIASDVVARPEGCSLFKNRDINSFVEVTEEIIINYHDIKNDVLNLHTRGSENDLFNFFKRMQLCN